MNNKLLLLVGAGIGYVLGARAGRERYDQIADQANKLWNDPRVQDKVEEVKHKAPEVAQSLGNQAKAKVDEVRSKASDEVDTMTGSSSSSGSSGSTGTSSGQEAEHESLAPDGSYSNPTGRIDPETGPEVDSSKFGPKTDKLP